MPLRTSAALAALAFLAATASAFRAPAAAGTSLRVASSAVSRSSPLSVAAPANVLAPRFITQELANEIAQKVGTPAYVYDGRALTEQAEKALAFPNAFGLTVRFAMKSCPNRAVLQLFQRMGICIDASSGYEIDRAMAAGFEPEQISLSSQEMPDNIAEFVAKGAEVNACSVEQLKKFGKACPGSKVGLRFNPGLGSGGTGKTNVGGPSSSFGIWHEQLPQVKEVLAEYDLTAVRVHTHIGSGSDPAVWQRVASLSLALAAEFPECTALNLGGGYKTGRMPGEPSTDLATVGAPVKELFEKFAVEHGRELTLEIEPGTFLVANAGSILATVQDMTSTKGEQAGADGRDFLKLDCGMTEIARPSLYGAQHPIAIIPREGCVDERGTASYIVSGHCCESGDLLTCAPDEPETLQARQLVEARVGDFCVIDGAGAYCSGMATKNYNSFPEAAEVLLDSKGQPHVVRVPQTLEQMLANERPLGDDFA